MHLLASLLLSLLALVSCTAEDRNAPASEGGRPDGERAPVAAEAPQAPAAAAGPVAYYLTGHGTGGTGDPTTNTVFGLDAAGRLIGPVVSFQDPLAEPRGLLLLADNTLLVAASWKENTHIVRYGPPGPGGVRPLLNIFASQGADNPAMLHSYALAQAPDGSIYVSNQDTATITRYAGVNAPEPGTPLTLPSSVSQIPNAPPGLFAPSSTMTADGLKDVRGITFGPDGLLYVADRGAAEVIAYDPSSGARLRTVVARKNGLQHPIQPRFGSDPDHLYVSDNGANAVLRIKLSSGEVHFLISSKHGDLKEPGALLLEGDDLYVGDRKTMELLRFTLPAGRHRRSFSSALPTPPEFLIAAQRP
jgi:hypothetical protein